MSFQTKISGLPGEMYFEVQVFQMVPVRKGVSGDGHGDDLWLLFFHKGQGDLRRLRVRVAGLGRDLERGVTGVETKKEGEKKRRARECMHACIRYSTKEKKRSGLFKTAKMTRQSSLGQGF